MYDHKFVISKLQANIKVFQSFFESTSEQEIIWKQSPEKWSLLEIVCHLYDEECEDFRTRLKQVLVEPDKALPPIDPVAWVIERKYSERNFFEMTRLFLEERNNSIKFLNSFVNPIWENAYQHPKFGPLSAKMFLANWLEHDYLHIRQMLKLRHDHLAQLSKESLKYAGNW